MTSLVAVRCKDGVVIGSDSSATLGDSAQVRTIEQLTDKKIAIVGNTNKLIIAGTGYIGHHQRFVDCANTANAKGDFNNKPELEIPKLLSKIGVDDFMRSFPTGFIPTIIKYSAFVAYKAHNKACLCELNGAVGFQPEVRQVDDLWFTSAGSGQPITDSFLSLFSSVFWENQAPDVRGGIFTVYWALKHACEVNPGGVNFPIKIAIYAQRNASLDAWMLSEDEMQETKDLVAAASEHFAGFRDVLLGKVGTKRPPPPPAAA
jgi:hypothetical protein